MIGRHWSTPNSKFRSAPCLLALANFPRGIAAPKHVPCMGGSRGRGDYQSICCDLLTRIHDLHTPQRHAPRSAPTALLICRPILCCGLQRTNPFARGLLACGSRSVCSATMYDALERQRQQFHVQAVPKQSLRDEAQRRRRAEHREPQGQVDPDSDGGRTACLVPPPEAARQWPKG